MIQICSTLSTTAWALEPIISNSRAIGTDTPNSLGPCRSLIANIFELILAIDMHAASSPASQLYDMLSELFPMVRKYSTLLATIAALIQHWHQLKSARIPTWILLLSSQARGYVTNMVLMPLAWHHTQKQSIHCGIHMARHGIPLLLFSVMCFALYQCTKKGLLKATDDE